MNSFKSMFIFIILISFISIISAQNSFNPIQFTLFDKEIKLDVEANFKCELKFPDNDETIDIWNWKIFLMNPDSLNTLVFEDSIKGTNKSTFSVLLDTIPFTSFWKTTFDGDTYQGYSGIVFVNGVDSKGKKHSIAKAIRIIGEFIHDDITLCCEDFIQITSKEDTIYENGEFFFSAVFVDDDFSGTTCEYWNWRSSLITSEGSLVLAKEDSVYGLNKSNWNFILDNFNDDNVFAKDSLNNIFGFVELNIMDSNGLIHFTHSMLSFSSKVAALNKEKDTNLPTSVNLNQNYPNPFNPITNITFRLENPKNVFLEIFDLSGKLVKTLLKDTKVTGSHKIQWDGANNFGKTVSSAIYIYTLKTNEFSISKKMVLIR